MELYLALCTETRAICSQSSTEHDKAHAPSHQSLQNNGSQYSNQTPLGLNHHKHSSSNDKLTTKPQDSALFLSLIEHQGLAQEFSPSHQSNLQDPQ